MLSERLKGALLNDNTDRTWSSSALCKCENFILMTSSCRDKCTCLPAILCPGQTPNIYFELAFMTTCETLSDGLQMIAFRRYHGKKSFINYKKLKSANPTRKAFLRLSWCWGRETGKKGRLTIPMADHKTPNYGLLAPRLNRGPTAATLTEHFFYKSPSWIYPTSGHMQWWSYQWGQLFSEQNQPQPFDAWFFYYTGSTSKTCLHQTALTARKQTAQQSISNSAIHFPVKGMQ